MATLRRSHAPVPWGAQVENTVWERSRPGKPRRRRINRPSLAYDPGWDWDGTHVLSSETPLALDAEDDSGVQGQLWEDARSPLLSGKTQGALSLFDVARHQVTKRRKTRFGLDDFEVIKVPRVMPVSEEGPEVGNSWGLSEWDKLDELDFRRTYSKVVEGSDPASTPGCSCLAESCVEDDSEPWECLYVWARDG